MPELSFSAIQTQLKQKNFQPIYFFHGEEAYFIDELMRSIEQTVLPDEQKGFNQITLYGKDIGSDLGLLVDNCMRLPMMAQHQVVLVKEAQHIRGWSAFLPYVKNPTKSTILAIAHKNKSIDGRSTFGKEIKKHAVTFTSKEIKEYRMPEVITDMVKQKEMTITPKATQLLIEFLGNNLSKVSNELNKLRLVLRDGKITPTSIEENIGISKDYNVYELQDAILRKDASKVYKILHYFTHNPKAASLPYIIGVLYNMFSKLYTLAQLPNTHDSSAAKRIGVPPYFFKKYIGAMQYYPTSRIRENIMFLNKYDLRSKGVGNVNTPPNELLRELIFLLIQ